MKAFGMWNSIHYYIKHTGVPKRKLGVRTFVEGEIRVRTQTSKIQYSGIPGDLGRLIVIYKLPTSVGFIQGQTWDWAVHCVLFWNTEFANKWVLFMQNLQVDRISDEIVHRIMPCLEQMTGRQGEWQYHESSLSLDPFVRLLFFFSMYLLQIL